MSRSNQGMRNLQSAGKQAAKFTGGVTEKAAVGLFRWATTDHNGMGRALSNMPSMEFFVTIGYVFRQFVIGGFMAANRQLDYREYSDSFGSN